ncbi:MAG: GNAT family N-acetyltransferase [Microthrixaceae bacterium]
MTGPTQRAGAPHELHLGDRHAAATAADAAAALAAAFQPDPMMQYLVPDSTRRRRMLLPYFGAVLRQAGRRGRLRVIGEGTGLAAGGDPATPGRVTVAGAAIAMPPGTYPLPVLPQLAEWRTMVTSGWGATLRNFRDLPPIDAARPSEPYWYLMYLGVHPDQQGHGHGAALLGDVLADADRDQLPAYLVTMKEANLAWYGRFGFAVREELRLGRSGPPTWTMLRPAASSPPATD